MNKINLLYFIILFMSKWPQVFFTSTYTANSDILTIIKANNESTLQNENFIISKKRSKRYLNFMKGARMSWRVNTKNNILQLNNNWAYGYGFRANFPFPDNRKSHKRYQRSFRKHDMFNILVELLNSHGFDGEACLLKCYCTALIDGNSQWSNGMLFKLLNYIFSLNDLERQHFPYLRQEHCYQLLHSHCPLSFNSISSYTDAI